MYNYYDSTTIYKLTVESKSNIYYLEYASSPDIISIIMETSNEK